MIEPKDRFYRLEYQYGDYNCVVKFNGDVDGDELKDNLKDFLRACSWSQTIVDRIFNEGETNDD